MTLGHKIYISERNNTYGISLLVLNGTNNMLKNIDRIILFVPKLVESSIDAFSLQNVLVNFWQDHYFTRHVVSFQPYFELVQIFVVKCRILFVK